MNGFENYWVADLETDDLDAKVIWCLVVSPLGKAEPLTFTDSESFKQWLEEVKPEGIIGHNFIGFDSRVLSKLWDINLPTSLLWDTLTLARMDSPNRKGGNSLAAWGDRLGCPKLEFKEFNAYTPEMESYCQQDVEVTRLLFLHLMGGNMGKVPKQALRLEHSMQSIVSDMEDNGVHIDKDLCLKIYTEALGESIRIENAIKEFCRPKPRLVRVIEPKLVKDGSRFGASNLRGMDSSTVGGAFSRIDWQEFNLGSPQQVVERLNEYGWKPYIKTQSGKSFAVCEENLKTIPDTAPPAIRDLSKWKVLQHRYKLAEEWLSRADRFDRVHGRVTLPGAKTHRASHDTPNMANVPSVIHGPDGEVLKGLEGLFGWDCRAAITAQGGIMLGVDASGIQLRVLAHYMNDKEYTQQVVDGDVHTFNMEALGGVCKSRDVAKTFIYAFLLGAGIPKLAQILGCSYGEAKYALDYFYKAIPSLSKLKQRASMAAQRGYLRGLDGRFLEIESDHKALSVYLQGGETVIMRAANVLWYNEAKRRGINFRQVLWVHDEWQTEVAKGRAEELGDLQVQSIRDAGVAFKLNCPLDGEAKIGTCWADTH